MKRKTVSDFHPMLERAGHKLVARLPGDCIPVEGQIVQLAMDTDSVILFDPPRGQH